MKSLQEKFQTILPSVPDEDDGTEWTDLSASRHISEEQSRHRNNQTAAGETGGKFNEMPPNMELCNENEMLRQIAGCTDFSYDTNPEAFQNGFTRRPMNGTDDLYTGEHADHFYGEAVGDDGNPGFAERNNYLDRM